MNPCDSAFLGDQQVQYDILFQKKKYCEEQLRKALDSTLWFLHMCSQAHAFTQMHTHTQSDVSNGGSQGRVIISKYKKEKLWEHNMSL